MKRKRIDKVRPVKSGARQDSPGKSSSARGASQHDSRERLFFTLFTVGLFALATALHFWNIGSAPPGFYADESSHGYNAYCIAETGADEYAVQHPIFFQSFGEFKDPVLIYSIVPFVKLFGLEKWATRLPTALFLMASCVVFAFLVQEHCHNKWLSVAAAFCFSLLPWLFAASRATTPYTAMLFGMTMGWLFILLSIRRQSHACAIGAGVAWAFAMYAYSIGRPMTVLLLVCFGITHLSVLRKRWKLVLLFLCGYTGALLPMIISVARTPQVLTNRFSSLWTDQASEPSALGILTNLLSRYPDYFSPAFLFLKGDQNLRQHTGHGGELFVFLAPLILAGLYCLVRFARSQPGYRFIGLGLLLYPLAAALTPDQMHSGRCVNGAIFWMLTAAIGADFLWRQRGIGRTILLAACCVGLVEMGWYLNDYFGPYQARSRVAFSASLTEVLADCFRLLGTNETLYVSPTGCVVSPVLPDMSFKPLAYMNLLFFGKVDPRVYQKYGIPEERISPYTGVFPRPGLLLRCNVKLFQPDLFGPTTHVSTRNGRPMVLPNDEPIPGSAQLVETKPFSQTVWYEVFRITTNTDETTSSLPPPNNAAQTPSIDLTSPR